MKNNLNEGALALLAAIDGRLQSEAQTKARARLMSCRVSWKPSARVRACRRRACCFPLWISWSGN